MLMSRLARRMALVVPAALALALASVPARAASIVGQNGYVAALYGNPFTGSNNTFGSATGTVSADSPLSYVVNQRDGRFGTTAYAGQLSTTDNATGAFMNFVAPAQFKAGTVIGLQSAWPAFNVNTGYTLKLDGNTIQTNLGAPGTSPFVITALEPAPMVQTLRLENMGMSAYSSSATHYVDMNEVMVLPDRLGVVSSTASATSTTFDSIAALNDLTGQNGWYSNPGESAMLTFSGTKTIKALILTNYDNNTPVSFDIYNDANVKVASGSMLSDGSGAEFVAVNFLTPVTTTSLKFTLTGGSPSGFTEIIPLESVPEPTSLALVALSAVGLLRRRRAMFQVSNIGRLAVAISTFAVAIMLTGGTMAQAATVTGALSIYSNPFDPNNDGVVSPAEASMSVGTDDPTPGASIAMEAGYSQSDGVNRHDTYYDSKAIRMIDPAGIATSAYAKFTTASSFNAGTVISNQFVYGPFDNATPYTIKLDGTTVQSGPGIQGTSPIQVTRLASVVSANQLRLDVATSRYQGSTARYAMMNEMMVLPTRLFRIAPVSVTQTAGTSWFNVPGAVSDLDGYGWGGISNPSLKLTFAQPILVDTIVVANFDSSGGPVNFNIRDDQGALIGNVQLQGASFGEFVPIHFDSFVFTSFLTFDFTDVHTSFFGGETAMREIIVLAVPEPTTAAFLGLGCLLLARSKRKH